MKVKVIKLDERYDIREEEKERVGKVFEALKYHNTYDEDERYHDWYALGLEDCVWHLPSFCCEVVEEGTIYETTETTKTNIKSSPLLVEDGSVDIDKLEADGFYVICYRQGSIPPMWLKD